MARVEFYPYIMSLRSQNIAKAAIARSGSVVPLCSRDDLMWLAGWWEGEGCFSKGNGVVMIGTTTDKDVAERVARITGGKLSLPDKINDQYKQPYAIRLSGHRCRVWMLRLRELMSTRRKARIDQLLSEVDPDLIALITE